MHPAGTTHTQQQLERIGHKLKLLLIISDNNLIESYACGRQQGTHSKGTNVVNHGCMQIKEKGHWCGGASGNLALGVSWRRSKLASTASSQEYIHHIHPSILTMHGMDGPGPGPAGSSSASPS